MELHIFQIKLAIINIQKTQQVSLQIEQSETKAATES